MGWTKGLMTTHSKLENIKNDVLKTPLDLSVWVEYFFLSVIELDQNTAEQTFAKILPFIGEPETTNLFYKCLTGQTLLIEQEGFYWVSDKIGSEWNNKIASIAKEVTSVFQSEMPVILFVFHTDVNYPPYSVSLFQGAGVIFLPPIDCAPNVIAHEVAHCIMTSGHNFLDESLAYWIEEKFLHEEDSKKESLLPISQCLNMPEIEQLNGFSEDEILRVYKDGARFINSLIDQVGVKKLKHIYSRIPLWIACDNLKEELEKYHDISLMDSRRELNKGVFELAEGAALIEAMNTAFFSGGFDELEIFFDQSNQKTFPATLRQRATLSRARALFALCFFDCIGQTAFHISSMKSLIDDYNDNITDPSDTDIDGIIILLLYKLLLLKQSSSYMDIREYDGHIVELFSKGLALDSGHVELNLLQAIKLMVTPAEYGGDWEQAYRNFSVASQDIDKGESIKQFISAHFEEVEL
jgi:hypothetical protein